MAIRSSLVEDEFNATSLATINEEDGPAASQVLVEGVSKKDKRRKKRDRSKANSAEAMAMALEDHDTAQHILVDLCTELKRLKSSIEEGHAATTAAVAENLACNQGVLSGLAEQMSQLDAAIESKATPEQIEELARIRAVQEMLKVVTDDKERTVELYEAHAQRGYEEIERLRGDLELERKEVASLRAELATVLGERQRLAVGMNNTTNSDGGSVERESGGGRPGAVYVGGPPSSSRSLRLPAPGTGMDFDDMTLETRGSYDTVAYEMKSLKKRILHMKKKLTIAQADAKEAGDLRVEAESLRVKGEAEKRAGTAKDTKIRALEVEVEELQREWLVGTSRIKAPPAKMQSALLRTGSSSSSSGNSYTVTQAKSSRNLTKQPSKKWWAM